MLNFTIDPNINTLRLGSSSRTGGQITGAIAPHPDNIYHFGGGGGTLYIDSSLADSVAGQPTSLEMSTTARLLPGRVVLRATNSYSGPTMIYAGSLQLENPNAVAASPIVSVNTTCQSFDGAYYWVKLNQPALETCGQLLLNPHVVVPRRGSQNATGRRRRRLDRQRSDQPFESDRCVRRADYLFTGHPAGVQTNLLHLGGEFSSGVMTKSNLWTIADNAGTLAFMPVALVKSGINSTLDLSAGGQNTYTGGTSIIGGTIVVSSSNQLGGNVAQGIAPGPIMIANGGQLRITRQHDVHARPQRHDLRNAC